MRAVRVDDVDAYLALVGPFLRAREAEHNLALGLLGRLRVEPRLYGFDPTSFLGVYMPDTFWYGEA